MFGAPAIPSAWDHLLTPPLAAALMALAVVDLRTGRLPDALTLPLLAAGLALGALRAGSFPLSEAIGAAAGTAAFGLIGHAFFRLRGRDGLGLGDAKLLGAAGAWLGWQALPALVLAAALAALAFAVLSGRGRAEPLPFGPWLAGAFGTLWGLRLAGLGIA